jgi:hypothetical protein
MPGAVHLSKLPLFSNMRVRCPRCGGGPPGTEVRRLIQKPHYSGTSTVTAGPRTIRERLTDSFTSRTQEDCDVELDIDIRIE